MLLDTPSVEAFCEAAITAAVEQPVSPTLFDNGQLLTGEKECKWLLPSSVDGRSTGMVQESTYGLEKHLGKWTTVAENASIGR